MLAELVRNLKRKIAQRYFLWRGLIPLRLGFSLIPKYYVENQLEVEKIITVDGEKKSLEFFLGKIQEGDVVFDVGANIGLYTIPSALKTGEKGMVYAFEPVPIWFNRLRENIDLNQLINVKTHNIGFFSRNRKTEIVIKNVQGSGMGSVFKDYEKEIPHELVKKLTIGLVRGDEFLKRENIALPNVVKIDTEGAELEILKGLRRTIENLSCRFIFCEVHPGYLGASHKKVQQLLIESGYEVRKVAERRNEYYLAAQRKTA